MPNAKPLTKAQIQAALDDLDAIARSEYGTSLQRLLQEKDDKGAQRVQRIVGISVKRKFAKRKKAAYTETGAKYAWPWPDNDKPVKPIETGAKKELELLNELRKSGPWNERTVQADGRTSWKEFKDDVDSERGLFKIIALYAMDKVNKRPTRKLREYFDAEESREFEAGLDLATQLFDTGVTGALLTALGIPTLTVGVALVGVQFGFRRLTDNNRDRAGDKRS